MIFKSYILENNLQTIENCKIFLFYGENQGLKKDFKEKLKSIYKKNDLLNFIQTDIIKNKEILLNEVSNKSLFNERKIIFIDQVNDKILDNFEEPGIDESIKEELSEYVSKRIAEGGAPTDF